MSTILGDLPIGTVNQLFFIDAEPDSSVDLGSLGSRTTQAALAIEPAGQARETTFRAETLATV